MITLEGVTKRYGERRVVDRVSFEVGPRELVALVGGSGSGKTTTLKMVNRLIDASEGRVTIGGQDTREIAGHELRRRIGYVFQEVGLFPHMTVRENMGITPRLCGWAEPRIDERVAELFGLVELEPEALRERMPRELSGGQRQRVGIARALAADPRVLLLDEPFGALDPITRKKLQRLLARIRAARELSAILVTHDIDEALRLADRVAVLRDGRLLQIGAPAELRDHPADAYVRALVGGDGELEEGS